MARYQAWQDLLVRCPQSKFGPADLPVCNAPALLQVSQKDFDIFSGPVFQSDAIFKGDLRCGGVGKRSRVPGPMNLGVMAFYGFHIGIRRCSVYKAPQSPLSKVGLQTSRRLILGLALPALLFAQIREVSAVELNVLAAGAVEAVVRDVVGSFEKENGHTVKLTYAPVGALRDKIYAGEPADLTIVTPVIIEQLLARGLVHSGTRTDLGRVGGGIAVRKGVPRPAIGTPEELKQTLVTAKEIYYADPKIATAGAYFLQVADRLGIGEEVRRTGRTAGGGKDSMELMARSTVEAIGLTQISEILSVPEVELVGPYPGDLQLMTTYTGILLERTPHPAAAEAFLRFLTSPPVQARFRQQGYEVPVR
jgi:molybdate transport system substrate-binding protein